MSLSILIKIYIEKVQNWWWSKMVQIDKQFLNIFCLSIGFMFIFFSFQPMCNLAKVMHTSIQKDVNNFTADGFDTLAIIFGVFSVSNSITPSVMAVVGPKIGLIGGSIMFVMYVLSFFHPENILVYVTACFCGFGISLLWTASGIFLTMASNEKTITRNSGIFWAVMHFSIVVGNIFVFYELKDVVVLDRQTRAFVYTTFALVASASIPIFFGLQTGMNDGFTSPITHQHLGPISVFRTSLKLIMTKNILLLSFTFSYCGFVLSFCSGILSTATGFTQRFHLEAKQMIGIQGLFISVGEVFGAILMGISGWRLTKWGRSSVIFGALTCHLVAYLFIFLTLPNESIFGETYRAAIIPPSKVLVSFAAFLIGCGDSIFNTQTICLLSIIYADDCASAFALFKFFQSTFATLSFIYAAYIGLYYQLLILFIFAIVGALCFFFLDKISERKMKQSLGAVTSIESHFLSEDSFSL